MDYDSNKDVFAVAGYTSDGILDSTFGASGVTTTAMGSSGSIAYCIAIDSSNKIILAGEEKVGGANVFAVARYT